MNLRFAGVITVSISLHVGAIFLLSDMTIPVSKPENKTQINSYLVIQAKASPMTEQVREASPEPVPVPVPRQEAPVEIKSTQEIDKSTEIPQVEADKTAADNLPPLSNQPALTGKTVLTSKRALQNTRSIIKQLHEQEVSALAKESLQVFSTPQAIKTKKRKSQKADLNNPYEKTFAPQGADIEVISTFGPNEMTLMMKGTCVTVEQTDLLDKVYRGALILKGTGNCGKQDKFNGQLQKSLDKFLKK